MTLTSTLPVATGVPLGDNAFGDRLANDLVGSRLVLHAALAAPPPGGVSSARWDELENREREAGELPRAVLAVLSRRRRV